MDSVRLWVDLLKCCEANRQISISRYVERYVNRGGVFVCWLVA